MKIECIGIYYFSCSEPLVVALKVISNFLPVKDSIDHVAAKQAQLYLISCMRMDLLVLVDGLEDM
jgi:hypothetical protein